MRLLVDTHAFLWWLHDDRRLAKLARSHITASTNAIFISAASIWEIAIKVALGKLTLVLTDKPELGDLISACGFQELAVSARHAAEVCDLPLLHADPFGRLLVAQARLEGLTVITGDPQLARYGIPTLSAVR